MDSSNNCIFALSHCQKLKDNNVEKCEICDDGFYLTADNTCLSNDDFIFNVTLKIIFFSLVAMIFLILMMIQYFKNRKR